jgi:hypothetical protein
MRRKHWIIAVPILALLLLVCVRVFLARSYMQQEIERVARKGHPGYEISGCYYLRVSDYGGFRCLTIIATRKADPNGSYRVGDPLLAVDFPWLPFRPPKRWI